MDILFIEDERELRVSGVAQLESRGHTVYSVSDLTEARVVMEDPERPVKMVLADQRLPDGQGLQFIIQMKPLFPDCVFAIVSGCLTEENVRQLKANNIPYFYKPLLYAKVVEELRREQLNKIPVKAVPAPESQPKKTEKPEKPKKLFGFFRK